MSKSCICVAATMSAMLVASCAYSQNTFPDTAYERDWSPLSVSIMPAVEFPPQNWDVYGLRINVLVGKHHDVGGIDIGMIANLSICDAVGLQASGIFSRTDNVLTGCQVSPLSFAGTLEGIQIGIFNRAEGLFGLQIGVVNYAYQANGVQLGLINIIADSELPILPVVNIGF